MADHPATALGGKLGDQAGRGTVMSGVIGVEEHYRHPGEFFTVPNKVKEWCGPPRPVVA